MIKLSRRESEALSLFSQLGRWTLVAQRMNVSISTVKTHRENAMRKLGVSNSVELLTAAIGRGLVEVSAKGRTRGLVDLTLTQE